MRLTPFQAKLKHYKAAILPHLTYFSIIWHFRRFSEKHKVERQQEKALTVAFKNESAS